MISTACSNASDGVDVKLMLTTVNGLWLFGPSSQSMPRMISSIVAYPSSPENDLIGRILALGAMPRTPIWFEAAAMMLATAVPWKPQSSSPKPLDFGPAAGGCGQLHEPGTLLPSAAQSSGASPPA